jgi:hypothetical protein
LFRNSGTQGNINQRYFSLTFVYKNPADWLTIAKNNVMFGVGISSFVLPPLQIELHSDECVYLVNIGEKLEFVDARTAKELEQETFVVRCR